MCGPVNRRDRVWPACANARGALRGKAPSPAVRPRSPFETDPEAVERGSQVFGRSAQVPMAHAKGTNRGLNLSAHCCCSDDRKRGITGFPVIRNGRPEKGMPKII